MPFQTPPPETPSDAHIVVTFPAEHILHVALNRPRQWNALNKVTNEALDTLWDWYEAEPSMRCAIMGTTAERAFCAGGDLIEIGKGISPMPKSGTGLAGLARRKIKKPIIAALRGIVVGGAVEMLTNLDVVVAGESAVLSLPEAKRGVPAGGGGLPRLVYLVGRQKAAEWLMTGRDIPAREAERSGLVNCVVPDSEVEATALDIAKQTVANSPDSVLLHSWGLRLVEDEMGFDRHMDRFTKSDKYKAVTSGENWREGMNAFAEKRAPRWVDSKL